MNICWLEQTETDVPTGNDWLNSNEALRLNTMRIPKRRADWRLGRWTAKRALSSYLGLPADIKSFQDIEICAASDGAPEAFVGGHPAGVNISLSHSSARAMCAVTPTNVQLGCDLETVEPRSFNFVADYFTATEQTRIKRASPQDQNLFVTVLWSAKESTLKALRTGLRLDTRSVIVDPLVPAFTLNGWNALSVRSTGQDFVQDRVHECRDLRGHIFKGWWQNVDNLVRTLVAAPAPESLIALEVPEFDSRSGCKLEANFA